MPFLTHGDEGMDVNNEHDWMITELMVQRGEASLPIISSPPFDGAP